MILSEREIETIFSSPSNQHWSTLVWGSRSTELISKCNLVSTIIVDLDCLSNRAEFLSIMKRWVAEGAKILHTSGLDEGMILCRFGQDAIVKIGHEVNGTSIYKRILASEDLYSLDKYIDRLIYQGVQYELQDIQAYYDDYDSEVCIQDFVEKRPTQDVGQEGSRRILEFPKKRIKTARHRKHRKMKSENVVQLSRNLDKYRSAEDAYYVRLQPTTEDSSGNFTHSLIAHPHDDLTAWNLSGGKINLKRSFRYLFIWRDTGRLAFVRLVKTRLTFFETVVKYPQYWEKELSETGFYLKSFDFDAPELIANHSNVQVRVNKIYDEDYYLNCWFDGKGITITEILDSNKVDALLTAVKEYYEEITSALVKVLLAPFKYSKNLTGVQANKFFVGSVIDDPFELKLLEIASDTYALSCKYDPTVDDID